MLLGTEFYKNPPFEVLQDQQISFANQEKDTAFGNLIDFMNHPTHLNQGPARKIFEKYEDDEHFTLLYSTYLTQAGKIGHSEIILSNYLRSEPNNLEILIKLAMDCFSQEKMVKGNELMEAIKGKLDQNLSLQESTFENLVRLITLHSIEVQDQKWLYEAYAWTLDKKYERLSKELAAKFGLSVTKPMPKKIEDLPEEHRPERAYPDTYFHHLELNKLPYHMPLSAFDEKYMDEISLQEIRAIQALKNEKEILHDIQWLMHQEVDNIKNQRGLFDPAGAKFAFIMASTLKADYAIEDVLAYLRLPYSPYLARTFKENFVHFIFNPVYHLASIKLEPFLSFLKEEKNPSECREAISQILNILAKENDSLSNRIYSALDGTTFQSSILEEYRIVENKMNLMVSDFSDIPIDFFEEDEEFEFSADQMSLDDSMVQLPGGGMVKKPMSLEETIFCNYLLVTMEAQKQKSTFVPSPREGIAPLRPVITSQKKIGRNDPCFCGSGKKYKKCCINNFN